MNAKSRPSKSLGRAALIGSALLVVAGAVALVHHRAAATVAAAAGPGAGGAALVGRQLRWDVTLETTLHPQGKVGAGRGGATTLTGEWVVTVSGASAGGTDVACELRHPHVAGTGFGDVDPADVARLEQNLAARFWVSYQVDGAATALHFPRALGDDVRNFLELLVTESQLVRPARPDPQWTATERDGAGGYLAAYRQPGPTEIVKRKIRYLALDGAGAPRASAVNVRIDGAETHYALDAQGVVRDLAGREALRIDAQMGAPGLDVAIKLHLANGRVGEARDLVGSLERAASGLETGPIVTQRASADELLARRDARLMRDADFARLLEAVERKQADATTPLALEAFLRRRPGDVGRAVAFVRRAGADAAEVVLRALGAAGTAATQDALGGLAADGGAPFRLRLDALGAFIETKQPTAATVSLLIQMMDSPELELRRQALYVAGAVGGDGHDASPGASAELQAALLDRWGKTSGDARLDLLVALGNLGTSAVVPALEKALSDPSAAIRAGAARALRKVKDPSADRLIAAAMTGDRDPGVRAAAVLAASFRPFGPLAEPLAHAVRADPVEYVRSDAIEAVASHVDDSPLIGQALLGAATSDPSPGIRRLARKTLGRRLASAEPTKADQAHRK